jgi:hypothetical protein
MTSTRTLQARHEVAIQVSQQLTKRLLDRLPTLLANPNHVGQKIVIHIPPSGYRARIEWPADSEDFTPDSDSG